MAVDYEKTNIAWQLQGNEANDSETGSENETE